MMDEDLDIGNFQMVGLQAGKVGVLLPKQMMTPDEALVHAAWLVSLAEPFANVSFSEVLTKVQNT